MGEKKIAIIGVGGRTGTMFAFELKEVADILGVGKEIEKIKEEKFFVEREGMYPELFKGKVILDFQFLESGFLPEILFLTTKNPVGEAVKYYYQKIKRLYSSDNLPALVLSQNGIVAGEEAISALKEVLGPDYKKIRVIRLILLNPVDKRKVERGVYITYSLPVDVCFGKISGPGNLQDIALILKMAGFRTKQFSPMEVKSLEISKLFLNLIGMASATRGLSIKEGFQKKEVFQEEIKALKEYIKVVRAEGENLVNLSYYLVKTFGFFLNFLPFQFLFFFKNHIAEMVGKERKGKTKDLGEIEYYNGAVISLGKEVGIPTPVNQRILDRCLRS